jgi:hypothetical protein
VPDNTDEVAKIELMKQRESIVAQLILSEVELDSSRRIGKMRKCRLPMRAPCDNSSRNANLGTLFLLMRP